MSVLTVDFVSLWVFFKIAFVMNYMEYLLLFLMQRFRCMIIGKFISRLHCVRFCGVDGGKMALLVPREKKLNK